MKNTDTTPGSMRVIGNTFGREEYKPLPKSRTPMKLSDTSNREKQINSNMSYLEKKFQIEIIMWMIIIPFIVFFFLLTLNPDFLKENTNEIEKKRDYMKLFLWTLVISIILWSFLVIFKRHCS